MTSFRTTTLLLAGAAIAATLLAGCTSTTEVDPSSTSSSTSEGTPTTAPSPTESAVGADPAQWTIDFAGVGPLTIGGSSAEELPQTAPAYSADDSGTCPNPATSILQSGANPTIWVQASDEGAGDIFLIAVGGDLPENARADGSPQTMEGVGIGSTRAATQAAYPAGTVESDPQGDPTRLVVDGEGPTGEPRYLVFDFSGDQVQTILVQSSPDVVNEFCA